MFVRLFFALATLVFMSGLALAQPVGRFQVEGTLGDQNYRGTIEVAPTGDTFEVHWQVEGTEFTGIGLWINDSFVVGYQGGGDVGVIVYRRNADGTWDGIWAPAGSQRTGRERILAAAPAPAPAPAAPAQPNPRAPAAPAAK